MIDNLDDDRISIPLAELNEYKETSRKYKTQNNWRVAFMALFFSYLIPAYFLMAQSVKIEKVVAAKAVYITKTITKIKVEYKEPEISRDEVQLAKLELKELLKKGENDSREYYRETFNQHFSKAIRDIAAKELEKDG